MVLSPPVLHQSKDEEQYESEQNNDMRFFGTPMPLPNRTTIKDTEFIAAVAGANVVQLRQRRTSTSAMSSMTFGTSPKTTVASEPSNQSLSDRHVSERDEDVVALERSNNNASYSQNPSNDETSLDHSTHMFGKSTPPRYQVPTQRTSSSSLSEKSRLGASNNSDGSFTSDSYSLLSSMQFISRDLEEEERANKSKSDRERAFLYKKRYMDVYGLAVGLTRRVTELEKVRIEQLKEIERLEETIKRFEKDDKLETLCREVNVLAHELNDPHDRRLNTTMTLMQHQLEKETHTNQQLQESLEHTQYELETVHTQWLKEKSDWIETLDQYKKQMHQDTETWKREVGRWKLHEKEMRDQLEQANHCILSLQTEHSKQLDPLQQQLVDTAVENQTMRHQLVQQEETITRLQHRIYEMEILRKSLHNQIMELKGNIRVFCRVRPLLMNETDDIFQFPDYHQERRQIELFGDPKSHRGYGTGGTSKKYSFDFDLVFNGTSTQSHVFEEVSTLIQSALDGYNVCIFAYGQTGSGKTYTMMHGMTEEKNQKEQGLVGRAMTDLFDTSKQLETSGWIFTISLEMIEIYNESLRDLLAIHESMEKVDLRLDHEGKPMVINSCIHVIENKEMACHLLEKALSKRATKTTYMNDHSSRSHCVISFRLVGNNHLTGEERKSVVHFIDLAGSERLSKSGSGENKEMLKEAQCINKSLSALGNVIAAIAKKSSHVPFRDSKLTHFLRPSLGGDSKTLMICNLSPLAQHREETLNSLRFAKMVNSCEIAYPSYTK